MKFSELNSLQRGPRQSCCHWSGVLFARPCNGCIRAQQQCVETFRRRSGSKIGPRQPRSIMTSAGPSASPATDQLRQVLFVETGFGCDQHGQDITKACVRACRNAIEFNSIPSIQQIVPGGYDNMQLRVKIGCPHPEQVKVEELRKVFPYGNAIFQIVDGGLCCSSGIVVERFGDTSDDMLIAVAAVTVGY